MAEAPDIFATNLALLARTQPPLAQRLATTAAAPVQWSASQHGPLTATIEHEGRTLHLASRYDPLAEADKLIASVDLRKHACVVILGMGLGYHVARLAAPMGVNGVMIVFEPDLALLRAVLEKIDHSAWLGRPNIVIADDQTDRAALLGQIDQYAGVLTQGSVLVTHPPTRQRFGDRLTEMGRIFAEALAFCRTNVATAFVNSARTVRNLCANLSQYAAGATTDELHGAAKGYPAVCVGAGPSLARNLELLADESVRRKVVVISAQTTLKVLLKRGIRPDFVTALDYAEISRRFYEGLPPLPDVTLVAEPKAHASILDSFPGPVRVTNSGFLDRLLGELSRPIVPIRDGATVAHLSFYLAQHLGCDPIILIGQDLGFSDGLYYCPGTAIHDVWAPELGAFNTLEMMEWQRIVRHRGHLRKLPDIAGRPTYTDEQMVTYLKQFERDFALAPQTILDATEGGLPKDHTTRTTLAQALATHATRPVPPLPIAPMALHPARLDQLAGMLERRLTEARELRRVGVAAVPVLRQMLEHHCDQPRMADLFKKLTRLQKRVDELEEIFELINTLNSLGSFKRARADRAIHHDTENNTAERQARQLERDLENVNWMTQACDEAVKIFEDTLARVNERRTSPPPGRRAGGVAQEQASEIAQPSRS